MREVDLCMAIGMFHYQSNGVPPDEEKINEWCETMTEVQECMGNYSAKCLSPVQRELITLLAGSDESAKQLCVAGSEIRANFLTHAECLADGADSDNFKTSVRDLQVMVETLFDTPFKQRFPLMCCAFRRFHKKVDADVEKDCGKDAVLMVQNLIKSVTTELPDIVCNQFDPESEECQAILPPSGQAPKGGESKSQIAKLLDTVLGNL